MRGAATLGGSRDSTLGLMCNDTGSNVLTIYPMELILMGIPENYRGWGGTVQIKTANGVVARRKITIAIRILSGTNPTEPITEWILEEAIVALSDDDSVYDRLSGGLMRRSLYFATAPGNAHLYVSQNKTGITQRLPTINVMRNTNI